MIRVDAAQAHAMVHDDRPLAFLDLREAGQYGEGHALFAMPLPYSRLECHVGDLVPRLSERVLLIDDGDGIAESAGEVLAAEGYDNLHLLDGGMPAWVAAGHAVYKGVNVPSKALGELAEAVWHPNTISANDLARWQETGRAHRLFDARPVDEHARMRVPGSVCQPNGELPHRIAGLTLPADTPVVITCAGRTRGIVGAIGLHLAGYDGPIYALSNGTQGWALAGNTLERDCELQDLAPVDAATLAASLLAAGRLADQFGLDRINAATADKALADTTQTTYLVDVRTRAEATLDPVPGALHAPGGQLVQATDQWLAVRHARVILCCDTGLRSAVAAFWLRQLGYDPVILPRAEAARLSAVPPRPRIAVPAIATIDPVAALTAMKAGARLVDLRASMTYRHGHVAGATWSIRPRLAARFAAQRKRAILLIADNADDAAFAARDLVEAGITSIRYVVGGHEGLRRAGAAIEASPGNPAEDDCIDHLFFVHDRHAGNLDAARRYLEWETGLVAQLSSAERAEFRLTMPPAN